MKDAPLKEALFRHFWQQRYFVQTEVDVVASNANSASPRTITDVDVFALRPTPSFRFSRIVGDCKTKKGERPISRAFWVSGLMRLLDAERGILLLRTSSPIERDHRMAADDIGVTIVSEAEFPAFDSALVTPLKPGFAAPQQGELHKIHGIDASAPKLKPLCELLRYQAPQIADSGTLLRRTLGHIKGSHTEFDPRKSLHQALLLDSAAVLAVGVAECAGTIFSQHLQPSKKDDLEEPLKYLVWGGRDRYQHLNTLFWRAQKTTRVDESEALTLPEWDGFVQLIRRYLNAPQLGLLVPWILRTYAMALVGGRSPSSIPLYFVDLPAIALATETLDYALRVARIDKETRAELRAPLNLHASSIAEASSTSASSRFLKGLGAPSSHRGTLPTPEGQSSSGSSQAEQTKLL